MLAARTIWISIMVVALLLAASAGSAQAQNPTNQELLDKMKAMEQRIQTLEGQLEQQKKAAPVPVPVPAATPAAAPATAPGTQPLAQTSPPAYPVTVVRAVLTKKSDPALALVRLTLPSW
jgi:hypothetical protein